MAPDHRYNSIEIARLINYVMHAGNKARARNIVYGSFDIIKKKTEGDPLVIFEKAKEHITPVVEVRSRRIGGSNLSVPIEVRKPRRFQLFLRWIIQSARNRNERTMTERLANEFIEASKGMGNSMKKRLNMDKSAQSHRAYSHLK